MDKVRLTGGSSYDLDLDRAIGLIRNKGASRVGLQAPEGLKRALPEIADLLSSQTGAEVIISGDPCYGACDLDMSLFEEVDLILHFGHAEIGLPSSKVVFIEVRMREDLKDVIKNAASLARSKTVGITTTVQHVHKIEEALEILKELGIEGKVGDACGRAKYPGQVLGCSYCTASVLDVDEYIFIGTGQFHPVGIALATKKRVITADPVTGEVAEIDPESMLRRRFSVIVRAWEEKRFAVLVSKKPGQKRWNLARRINELGRAKGKEMLLVYLDNIEPDRLLNLGFKAAVSTACPRVALDDEEKYEIPILTPPEFEVLVGVRLWEDYAFDEINSSDA